MSEKQLISKLGKVGNPITLLKMFKDVKKFIGDHQNNFLNNGSDDVIYLDASGEFYQVIGKKIEASSPVSSGNIVKISEQGLKELCAVLGLQNSKDLNQVYRALRRAKNIKNYKLIFEAIDKEFSTNVPVTKWATLGFKTLFEKEA
ncbi:hypothetical protein [Lactococcus raffinolactis]|uniref:hypothetical protein n=1 Tax=Pseudolactococcus raffinolactis TaxID=1366 RepID=UPI0039AEC610